MAQDLTIDLALQPGDPGVRLLGVVDGAMLGLHTRSEVAAFEHDHGHVPIGRAVLSGADQRQQAEQFFAAHASAARRSWSLGHLALTLRRTPIQIVGRFVHATVELLSWAPPPTSHPPARVMFETLCTGASPLAAWLWTATVVRSPFHCLGVYHHEVSGFVADAEHAWKDAFDGKSGAPPLAHAAAESILLADRSTRAASKLQERLRALATKPRTTSDRLTRVAEAALADSSETSAMFMTDEGGVGLTSEREPLSEHLLLMLERA